jgi:hypothetical protein
MDVDDPPHVADEDEGRSPVILGKGAGVFDRLRLGRPHQILAVSPAGATGSVCLAPLRRYRLPLPHPALLGFEHEGVASVQIDPRGRPAASLAAAGHGALEDIIVALVRGVGGIGFGQVERAAQADQEELVVRPLLPALAPLPSGDEGFEIDWRRQCTRKEHAKVITTKSRRVYKFEN